MVKVGEYNIGEVVGQGTFSSVKMATHMKTGEKFVAKVVSREAGGSVDQDVRKEIHILRKVKHDNVVRLKEILMSQNNYYIILEPVLGGDLLELLVAKYSDGMPREHVRGIFAQIVSGVAQCHGVGVAHRDLKPENLLVTPDMKVKISDFGLSRLHKHSQHEAQSNEMSETVTGTLAYLPPEMLQGPYDAFKGDMWSMGCILYALTTGRFPFGSAIGPALEHRILSTPIDPLPSSVEPDVVDLIHGMLEKNPDRRLTLPQVAAHPFLHLDDGRDLTLVEEEASPRHGPAGAPRVPPGEQLQGFTTVDASAIEASPMGGGGGGGSGGSGTGSAGGGSVQRRLQELNDDSDDVDDDDEEGA
jgi:serine/threonine protein kinase